MAITGQLVVTPEALSAQSGQVQNAAGELKDCFDQMKKLMGDTTMYWKGEAAEAHREGYSKNQASIDEIIARYQEHVRDLEAMAGVYREAETSAMNQANELPASTL